MLFVGDEEAAPFAVLLLKLEYNNSRLEFPCFMKF